MSPFASRGQGLDREALLRSRRRVDQGGAHLRRRRCTPSLPLVPLRPPAVLIPSSALVPPQTRSRSPRRPRARTKARSTTTRPSSRSERSCGRSLMCARPTSARRCGSTKVRWPLLPSAPACCQPQPDPQTSPVAEESHSRPPAALRAAGFEPIANNALNKECVRPTPPSCLRSLTLSTSLAATTPTSSSRSTCGRRSSRTGTSRRR